MALIVRMAALLVASGIVTPALCEEPKTKPPVNLDKVHCVRTVETGSLMVGRKECHTEAEWRTMQAESRLAAANMMNAVRSNRMDADPSGPTGH